MFINKHEFENRNLKASAQGRSPKLVPKQFRSRTRSVVILGDAVQKDSVLLSPLQANDFHFDVDRSSADRTTAAISENGPDRHCPSARETRLRLVLQEIENEYASREESGYTSFPKSQISGMVWILDVLEDLASFAKSRDARSIVDTLVRTCAEVENELDAREASQRS